MSEPMKRRGMSGKDVITVGIFSAIYFVINFAFMLLGGLHPLLWILMPGFIALFTGIPYLMMCAKVQKVGSVLLMGLITGLIYYVTGQFTVVILVSFVLACGLAELTRGLTHYRSMAGNLVSFVLFSVGMVGSPLPIWLMREDFLRQITEQGMPADYVNTLAALSSTGMLVVLFLAPIVAPSSGASSPGPCSASTLRRPAWCEMKAEQRIFDPRAGLWLLIAANMIAFRPHTFRLELTLIGLLLVLMLGHGRLTMAVKWAVGYCALVVFQQFILPVSPMVIATSFTIFATYTRRMFPCLMTGALMLTCTPLRYLIVGLRQLHIPQKLIVAISVTLRYFPAIREEVGYIRDAMKLRNIRGLDRLECTVMPLMVSATETAEELSAAAVTRGIENPARKTSAVSLRISPLDFLGMLAGLALLVISFVVQ